MKINLGYLVNKFLRLINRPALRDCEIDKTARIGTGSNCIAVKVGRYSYMGKNTSAANARIGAFCSIASYCAIGGGAHPLDMISTSPVFCEGRNSRRPHDWRRRSHRGAQRSDARCSHVRRCGGSSGEDIALQVF